MPTRDTEKLSASEFDLLVIGAGVHGAAIAWDAALRGLSVALVDKGDFGGATSSGCFRIIHGGLRYLQHADISRLRESAEEQRIWRIIAPSLITPFPFLVPCYGFGMRSVEALRLATALYELLAPGRNRAVDAEQQLPRAKKLSAHEIFQIAPGINSQGLRGGVQYYDAQIYHCERLSFSFAKAAARAGAQIANYCRVDELIMNEGIENRISSVRCFDLLGKKEIFIRAKHIINAAGPWVWQMLSKLSRCDSQAKKFSPEPYEVFSKGVQCLLPGMASPVGLAIESREIDESALWTRGKRSYFLVPWRGQTLLGTADSVYSGNPDSYVIQDTEVDALLRDVSSAYSGIDHLLAKARFSFGGLRPVPPGREQDVLKIPSGAGVPFAKHQRMIDHARCEETFPRVENLLSVIGVKYTTARLVAEEVIDYCCANGKLQTTRPCATRTQKIVATFDEKHCGLSGTVNRVKRVCREFGSDAKILSELEEQNPHCARALGSSDVTEAEVIYAIREEMAQNLGDVVFRRTSLGICGCPDDQTLDEVGGVVRRELGWNSERLEQELAEVRGLRSQKRDACTAETKLLHSRQ